jgi:hypothetical protein
VELVETFSPDASSTAVTLTLRTYNGIDIPQRPDGYINATKMCEAAGKRWNNFWQTQNAQSFANALASDTGIPVSETVISIKGGDPWQQGTWVHPDLAVELARWISPEFAIICNRWVREIMEGRHPMPNEVSHEGAIVKGIAALIESQSKGMTALLESQNILSLNVGHLVNQSDKTIKKLDGLTEDVAHLDGRLKIVEHRSKKGFKKSVQAIYKKVVWKYFGGCCPVYPHIKILQSPEKQIITSRNRTAGEFDHYYAPHNNGLTEGWLVSVQANQDFIYNPALRTQYNHRFETFQDWSRMEYESELGIQLNII